MKEKRLISRVRPMDLSKVLLMVLFASYSIFSLLQVAYGIYSAQVVTLDD